MAKISVPSVLSNIPTASDLQRFLSAFVSSASREINGNLQFGQNIASSALMTVGFPDSSTIVGITHFLGRIPVGFLEANKTGPAQLYAPQGSKYNWTTTKIYLQSSAGVTASIFLI